jgi:hypothetical protein
VNAWVNESSSIGQGVHEALRQAGSDTLPEDGELAFADIVGCSICHDHLVHKGWALQCGHLFHGYCLEQACRQQEACPICRKRISCASDIRKIFLS